MLTRRTNMNSRGITGILLYAVCFQLSVFAATGTGHFKSKPSIVTLPIGARITFEVSQPTDVEIKIEVEIK